jgi:hypothetical protein
MCPKWHPIPYIVHYFWPEPYELWSKSSALWGAYGVIWVDLFLSAPRGQAKCCAHRIQKFIIVQLFILVLIDLEEVNFRAEEGTERMFTLRR